MIRLNGMLALAACALMATAACGDDETSTGTGGSGASGGSTTTAGGNGGSGGGGIDCVAVCGQVYTCMVASSAECPMIDDMTPQSVEDGYNDGCVMTCSGPLGAALAMQVDPNDCDGTVMRLKGLNMDLKSLCEDGPTGAGGGAGVGGGAAGGAGGGN